MSRAVVFFIGGAGDMKSYYLQGPNYNVRAAKERLDSLFSIESGQGRYFSTYLDYSLAKGGGDIDEYFLSKIESKEDPIYIVGHSLGGWNGAQLSRILSEKGYNVEVLVTLDPVGSGAMVGIISDIYWREPCPRARMWINVWARPKKPNISDTVANMGGRWYGAASTSKLTEFISAPILRYFVDISHAEAGRMFTSKSPDGHSPCDHISNSIRKYLNK